MDGFKALVEALKEGTAGDPADRISPAVGADVVEKIDGRELLDRLRPRQQIPREAWARRRSPAMVDAVLAALGV